VIGIFLISIYGVNARGIMVPNVLVGVLVFFGGICQFLAGIMEFISGNTVSILPSKNVLYIILMLPR
jgi:succinate-acetate transporter protein